MCYSSEERAIYVSDYSNNACRKILLRDRKVQTVYGVPIKERFSGPTAVAINRDLDIFVADQGNNKVKKVSPDGTVATVISLSSPRGLCIDDDDNLFIVDLGECKLRKISLTTGKLTIINEEKFSSPYDCQIDPYGNILIADFGSGCIYKISNLASVKYRTRRTQLQKDLQHLIENPNHSSTSILIRGMQFKLHKEILLIRGKGVNKL